MSKRALFPAFLGLLLLTLIACGGGSDERLEQDGLAATATPVITATETPEIAEPATLVPSPTPVATEGDLFLKLVEPSELEVFTNLDSLPVAGRTRVDALVTINDTIVEPNIDGEFSLDMALEEGPNIIEVVSSVETGEQMDLVLVAVYVP